MNRYYLAWKNTLNELNDFSCQVEFLQSKIRENVIIKKNLNISDYLISLKKVLKRHERNLNLIRNYGENKKEEIETGCKEDVSRREIGNLNVFVQHKKITTNRI